MKKTSIILVMLFIFLALSLPNVEASERAIINSGNWEDVYSGIIYSKLEGKEYDFLTSTRHATIIANALPSTVESVEILSSSNNPFITGYTSLIQDRGFEDVEEIRSNNLNLEILQRLPDIDRFIVLDGTYGYNAVSVAPFAVMGRYYVIMADEGNIGAVMNELEDRTVSEVIIYGHTDREVRLELAQYDPEIINTGDRFDDNIQMVEKYQELHRTLRGEPRRQAILTNGEFLEASIFTGTEPVLFIGFANVPDHVRSYIQQSDLEVGTLVGNELIGTATFIRRETGLSVFVKFGQGARTPTGAIAQVEDLDRFPIPRFNLDLDIVSAVVNTASQELEITYQNDAPIATYFRNILIRLSIDGANYVISDDVLSTFIDGNSFKTLTFPLIDGDDNPINVEGEEREIEVNTIYGESPRSLEQSLNRTLTLEEISVLDDAQLDIVDVSYSNIRGGFLIELRNPGNVDTYTIVEVIDLDVAGEILSFSSEEPISISPERTNTVFVSTTMTDEDVVNNQEIKIRAYYGERENSLIRMKEAIFEFKYATLGVTFYVIIILIILLLVLFFWRKGCKHCGYKNPAVRKTCKKCGKEL